MKYLNYDFSTLYKLTLFLKDKKFFYAGLLGAFASSLTLLAPMAAVKVGMGVTLISYAAPLLERCFHYMLISKKAIKAEFEEKKTEALKEFKPSVMELITQCMVKTSQNNKERIEKINANLLKGMISCLVDEAEMGNSASTVAAGLKKSLPDVEPLVLYYNAQLNQASTNAAEQNKIVDNFGSVLTLNVAERIIESGIEQKINNPDNDCLQQIVERIRFM